MMGRDLLAMNNIDLEKDGGVEVCCARTVEEVERLRPVWQRLQRHPNTDIDFYLTILKSRPQIERPCVILVRRGGQPRLLLIGRIEKRPLELTLGYKNLRGPMARVMMILYEGVLGKGDAEDYALVLEQLQRMLRGGEFDLAEFNHLDVHSPMYAQATTRPSPVCRANGKLANPHLRLSLPATYAAYQAGLSRGTRKTLRRYGHRLLRDWGERLSLRCYRGTEDLETVLHDAETVARKTYQRGLGVGFQAGPEMRRRIRLELERGWLRAYFLYMDGEPAAFSLINCYRGIAYANETGYDPAYGGYRIGHYLNERIVEELCAERSVQALDYGLGDAEYKRAICDQVWEEKPVLIFAPTWRGLNLHALYSLFGVLRRVGRVAMEKVYLLPTLKRRWRRSSIPPAQLARVLLAWVGLHDEVIAAYVGWS